MSLHEMRSIDRYRPNAAMDYGREYFRGFWPMESFENRPRDGESVVYFLWNSDWSELLYVGSTLHFYQRMKQHKDKPFARWQAFQCSSRLAAYQFEARYLQRFKPRFNKRLEPLR